MNDHDLLPAEPSAPPVLAVDVGGSHVKMLLNGGQERRRFASGKRLTPEAMVTGVLELAEGWDYPGVSVGVPAMVRAGRVVHEPANLGRGWVGFDIESAFGKPTKVVNDAAMQALGSYAGGRMLFLGLGTGLGSTMIVDGIVEPMELGHLPFRKATYEDYVGLRGLRAARPEAVAEGRSRDDRPPGRGARARLRDARRRKRGVARRAAAERSTRAQRRRLPRRLPALGHCSHSLTCASTGSPGQRVSLPRRERVELVLALLDDPPARLRNLVPGAREIAERLRDHDSGLVREPVEHRVVRVLRPQGVHLGAEEQRPRRCPRSSSGTPRRCRRPSSPPSSGSGARRRSRAPSPRSGRRRARRRAAGRPRARSVSARKKNSSESVDPSISAIQRRVDGEAPAPA